MEDVDARVHIFIATALGWGRVASPTLGSLYPPGTHFIGGWVDPRTNLALRSEEKSPPLRQPELNPGCPACSQAPCCLSRAITIWLWIMNVWDVFIYLGTVESGHMSWSVSPGVSLRLPTVQSPRSLSNAILISLYIINEQSYIFTL